jgi:hypothetical protein
MDPRAFAAEQLVAFKSPVKGLFRSETLPTNANDKTLEAEFRKLFADVQNLPSHAGVYGFLGRRLTATARCFRAAVR